MFNLSPRALDVASFTLKAAAVLIALNWVYEAGRAAEKADKAEQEAAVIVTRTAAAEGAASAISAIKLESRTVVQRTREITREVPAYRDCLHDQRVFDDLNKQLRGASKSPD